jgi:MFS family permease
LIYFLVPPITGHLQKAVQNHSPFHVLTDIWAAPNQRKALTLSAVLMIGHFSIIPFLAPSLVGNAAFSQDHIFLIYLVGGALTFFTSPMVGKIADKRGKYPVFVVFALLSLIPVWLITNLWPMPLWIVLAISSLFFIFINGRMIPVQAMVSGVVPPEQRGGFMSINSSIQQLSSGVAANLGGLIVVKTVDGHLEHYNWVGYISIILVLLSIWLASRLRVTTQ